MYKNISIAFDTRLCYAEADVWQSRGVGCAAFFVLGVVAGGLPLRHALGVTPPLTRGGKGVWSRLPCAKGAVAA